MLRESIQKLAENHEADVVAIRRHLHQHPELSFQEEQTSSYIRSTLEKYGIPFTTGWAGNGIVAIVEGVNPESGVVALRADMDALPIQEENDVPYRSVVPGVMHACGHDVHTASVLGAAAILSQLKSQFSGTVKLIFQPGEEKLPGGAMMMLKEGALKNPMPDGIIGQHVHPQLPAGSVGFRIGEAMASSDEITLTIIGKGGHGAMPHLTVDPVTICAQVIIALQQIVSRYADPMMPSVLTFGKINSEGGAFNVIPDSVSTSGTFRTFSESWRESALQKIREIAEGVAGAFGAGCEVNITRGYPVLLNDPELTTRCRDAAVTYLGPEKVQDIPARLTSEDFAYYTHQIPGCFYRLGVSNADRGITASVHTPRFDIDESALRVGSGLMAWLAITELGR